MCFGARYKFNKNQCNREPTRNYQVCRPSAQHQPPPDRDQSIPLWLHPADAGRVPSPWMRNHFRQIRHQDMCPRNRLDFIASMPAWSHLDQPPSWMISASGQALHRSAEQSRGDWRGNTSIRTRQHETRSPLPVEWWSSWHRSFGIAGAFSASRTRAPRCKPSTISSHAQPRSYTFETRHSGFRPLLQQHVSNRVPLGGKLVVVGYPMPTWSE